MVTQNPEADFRVTYLDEIPSVHIPVRLSVLEAVNFKTTCQQLFSENTVPSKIVLDFSDTTFIDSSGIGALVSNLKFAKQRQCDLVLRSLKPQVMAVFALTSLDQVLTIEPSPVSTAPAENNRADSQLPVTHPSVRSLVKRLIDIVGAIVGLIITGILFIPIVAAITINDPGPIFF
ncbi:MAG: STAS domain-containing protein, partial [Oscillatoriales cyanobacterium]